MHAVVVNVTINDREAAESELRAASPAVGTERLIPAAHRRPAVEPSSLQTMTTVRCPYGDGWEWSRPRHPLAVGQASSLLELVVGAGWLCPSAARLCISVAAAVEPAAMAVATDGACCTTASPAA